MSGVFRSGAEVPRKDLYEMVEELKFEDLGLQANRIAPPILVDETAATYPTYPKENIGKVMDINRAPDGSFNEDQWDYDSKSYTTKEKGVQSPVDVTQQKKNAKFVDEEEIAAASAKRNLYKGIESEVSAALYNETTFAGTALSGGNPNSNLFTAATDGLVTIRDEMDDKQNCRPRDVFETIYKSILRKKLPIAKKMWSIVMSDDLIDHIIESDDIINGIIYTVTLMDKPQEVKRKFLADTLGYKEIIPVSAMFDTTGFGTSKADFAKYWSNEYCLIGLLSNGAQTWKELAVARQPIWRGYASGQEFEIESWYNPEVKKIKYRACSYRGITVQPEYGLLLKNMKTTVGADGI